MNLAQAFADAVRRNPNKTALCWGDAEYTFEQLFALTLAVSAALRHSFGIRPGDRVAVWLKNRPEFVPALFGIAQAGAVIVPISHFLKPEEIAFILRDSGATTVISERSLAEAAKGVSTLLPSLRFSLAEDFESLPVPEETAVDRNEKDLAALLYTSGTTGHPKGAMLTHGNFLHNVNSCLLALDIRAEDRIVVALPQFHSFMFTVGTLTPMLAGAGILLLKTLHPFKQVLEEITRHHGTILPAVPSFYRALLGVADFGKLPLKLCVSGGAPLPLELYRAFTTQFPFPLREGYGPTESSPVATVNPIHGENRPGSIGIPIPGVELSIRDETGLELPTGQTGEICIRGGNVMLGYWNQPEETARALRKGWLYTGDMGHRDADGYFFITDRKKDMLLVNGINVYPREVEEIIHQFPNVKESAVVGWPDPRRGEQPVAFVVPTEEIHLEEMALLKFIRERLADYKVPRRVFFVVSLPRNATGKILKTELRQARPDGSTPPATT